MNGTAETNNCLGMYLIVSAIRGTHMGAWTDVQTVRPQKVRVLSSLYKATNQSGLKT